MVAVVTGISTARPPRAPKPRGCLFALAAAAAIGDAETKQAVKAVFPRVVRTTDHLAQFFGYWKNLAGKPLAGRGMSPVTGRAMRSAFASWFNAGDVHDVAFRALKARQRVTPSGEAMALRDIIRIAHPAGRTDQHRALIGWLAERADDEDARELLPDLDSFLTAQAVTTPREAVEVIRERRVPWDPTTDLVVRRLTSPDGLTAARTHPMDAYLALKVYGSGRSQPAPRKPANT